MYDRTEPATFHLNMPPWNYERQQNFLLLEDNGEYQPGDILVVQEYDEYIDRYTGRELCLGITEVLRGCPQRGLVSGHVILGVSPYWAM